MSFIKVNYATFAVLVALANSQAMADTTTLVCNEDSGRGWHYYNGPVTLDLNEAQGTVTAYLPDGPTGPDGGYHGAMTETYTADFGPNIITGTNTNSTTLGYSPDQVFLGKIEINRLTGIARNLDLGIFTLTCHAGQKQF